MKHVIVTGANGFIGSRLIDRLISEDVSVDAVDVSFKESHLLVSPLVNMIEASIDDHLVNKLSDYGYDAVYHLAWQGVNGADKANSFVQMRNIENAIHVANAAKSLKCKKLLFAGTVAENVVLSLHELSKVNGGMMYGAAKYAMHILLETYCKSIELPMIWMQFSNVYGPGNYTGNLMSYTLLEIISGRNAYFGPAKQPYDFIYIDDLIEALYRMGNKDIPVGSYFVGSGSPRILSDYLNRIGELTDSSDKIKIGVRPDDGVTYSWEMFDSSKLVDLIGDYNKTDFDNGIMQTIKWLSQENEDYKMFLWGG